MSKLAWNESTHQKRYVWLYNHIKSLYPKAKQHDYITFYKTKLLDIINRNGHWSDGSRENLFFMIVRWLEINEPNDKNNIQKYRDAGFKLKNKRDKEEGENALDEKEKENYRDYQYFVSILDSIDYDKLTTLTAHYKYLLLALLVLAPPVRIQIYHTAQIIQKLNEDDEKQNFLWFTTQGRKRVYYIINNDKASNYKQYSIDKHIVNKIEIENKRLVDLLYDSIQKYPRKYLFDFNGTQVSEMTLSRWLKDITRLPGATFDMMRSVYITEFYSKNPNLNAKRELARQMRHSVETASKNYLKIFPVNNKQSDELKSENAQLKAKIAELEAKVNELTPNDESKMDKSFIKKRKDILYLLNVKKKTSKQSTLNKYGIKYDSDKGVYV